MSVHPVLINGRWRDANSSATFNAFSPFSGEVLLGEYRVSSWAHINEALDAAAQAASQLAEQDEPSRLSRFLEVYAKLIELESIALVEMAHQETGLAREPRLPEIELPRTTGQLRQAAEECRKPNDGRVERDLTRPVR